MTTPPVTTPAGPAKAQNEPRRRGLGRFWPANLFRLTIDALGIDQRAQGYVGAIDRVVNRGLQGRTGHIPTGNSGSPAYRYNGYVSYGPLALTSTVGASTNLVRSPNVGLPSTGGPVTVTSAAPLTAVQASLAALTPGVR